MKDVSKIPELRDDRGILLTSDSATPRGLPLGWQLVAKHLKGGEELPSSFVLVGAKVDTVSIQCVCQDEADAIY